MNTDKSFKEESNPHAQKDMREVRKALSKLGLSELRRPRTADEPLDPQTTDYIHRNLDPEDRRLTGLPRLVQLARALASTSREYLQQSRDKVDRNVSTLHTFLHAPKGWFRELCARHEVVVPLTPTFPRNSPCGEVREAASQSLCVELCVDEVHVPPQLIVREIRVEEWGKEDRVRPCVCEDAVDATVAQTAVADSDSKDTHSSSQSSVGRSATRVQTVLGKPATTITSASNSQQESSVVSSSACSAAFSTDLPISSSCHSGVSQLSPSCVSLQVDPLRFTPETRGRDASHNAKTAPSCPSLCQLNTKYSEVDVLKREISTRFACPAKTGEVCSRNICSKDTLKDVQGEPEITHETKDGPLQKRDTRVVRESKMALVPEFSQKRVLVSGHYVLQNTESTLPFMMFVHIDHSVHHAEEGLIFLSGSYVRGMLTTKKNLRWRFRHIITAVESK